MYPVGAALYGAQPYAQHYLAPTSIAYKGELMYQNQQFSYQNWNSAQLVGKVRVIQHIAGRTSAKEMNDPLINAIKAANLAREYYQTTTIVNTDDAIIDTGPFVRSSLEESKKTLPGRSLSSTVMATSAKPGS